MKHPGKLLWIAAVALISLPAKGQLSLEECQRLARENYPLIKRYYLIRKSADYTLNNLNKGFLPQIAFDGKATWQSDVATLPPALQSVLASNGTAIKGLKKDQYRMAVDVNQLVYDGGNIKAEKEVIRAENEVEMRRNDVELYRLREKVNDLFFGILLTDNRLKLNEDLQKLLTDNCRKLEAMLKGGTAMQSDVDAVRAEYLEVCRQHTELESVGKSYRKMLGLFIGNTGEQRLTRPEVPLPPSGEVKRPELLYFDAQTTGIRKQMDRIEAGLRPRLSVFAQGFYGYPGYDMFHDMSRHDWSLNGTIGVRLNWDISRLYTRKNDRNRLRIKLDEIANAREIFLFNNDLQATEEREAIDRYRHMMEADREIISLRTSVRQSAETKLEHGIVDVNNLLQEITRENRARIEHSVHETEMLKSIWELKNTLNQ